MSQACDELFHYAIGFVTPADIAAFAPGDPGYPDYVRQWREILAARSIPQQANFDITETVDLTRWAEADRESDPVRFRRFRVFTSAVALGMAVRDRVDDDQFPPNYTLIRLIDDADALRDLALWRLLAPAFEEVHQAWTRQPSEEAPFGLLGLLLVHAHLGAENSVLETIAERLIEQESRCETRASTDFLFGCTHYDQLDRHWKRHVKALLPPASPSLGLVRDALLDSVSGDG